MAGSRESLVAGLRAQLNGWGSAWHPGWEPEEVDAGNLGVRQEEKGEAGWERILPRSWGVRGGLIEWFEARVGDGSGSAALMMAQQRYLSPSSGMAKWLVVIDVEGAFYPPGVVRYGVSLRHMIVVRVRDPHDLVWAWEQALRSSATAVVWGRVEKLTCKEFRRLQLAAEHGKTVGMLVRGAYRSRDPSWADWGFLVSPCLSAVPSWGCRRWKVQVVRCRGGKCGEEVILREKEEGWHG
jgi:hypothetical protein